MGPFFLKYGNFEFTWATPDDECHVTHSNAVLVSVVAWVNMRNFIFYFQAIVYFSMVVHLLLSYCHEVAWLLLFMTNSSLVNPVTTGYPCITVAQVLTKNVVAWVIIIAWVTIVAWVHVFLIYKWLAFFSPFDAPHSKEDL